MATFIKKRSSRAFLSETGHWTENLLEARHILRITEAFTVATELKLRDVELYYSFADLCLGSERWDFSIPLNTQPELVSAHA